MSRFPTLRPHWSSVSGSAATVVLVLVAGLLSACSSATSGASGLQVSGTSNGWVFHDGQMVTVSMPANSIFTPHVRINLLECADPGGTAAHLPTSLANCDENTVEGNSILPAKDGSFTEAGYPVYRLPSLTLGEQPNDQPVCDATHECVFYVGEDQDNFRKPKIFSPPFTVVGGHS